MTNIYQQYIRILEEELIPAMGCTEPIAIAYGAAYARALLGEIPEKTHIIVSGNLVKNAKSVTVPNTGGLRGIEASVAAGIIAGKPEKLLEVIADVTSSDIEKICEYLEKDVIEVELGESPLAFDYTITAGSGDNKVLIRVANAHTNIVRCEKNGEILINIPVDDEKCTGLCDHSCLSIENIVKFAEEIDVELVAPLLERQIEYNTAIAEEGLSGNWGACIGRTIIDCCGNDVVNRAKARAAAGSDARMNGCSLPVVILSGSGNQGITASVPVVTYAEHLNASREKLLRALLIADLTAIHLKTDIGRLSAFCGVVCAGAGAGAGICYLEGGSFKEIAHTVVNTLAISSGIICDGAKASCAGKIALSVEAGILGWNLYKSGNQFYGGDGIITKGVEKTIKNVGRLGHYGMKTTDREILEIMLEIEN